MHAGTTDKELRHQFSAFFSFMVYLRGYFVILQEFKEWIEYIYREV